MTKLLAKPFRESFEPFGTSSLTECEINRLYVFYTDTVAGPVNAFMLQKDESWTQTFSGPGRFR